MSLARRVGPLGLWTDAFDRMPAEEVAPAARLVEKHGVRTLWIPEVRGGRDGLTLAMHLLDATDSLVVANGIVRIGERSPASMASAARLLGGSHPGRHLLGLGVGAAVPEGLSPLASIRQYLVTMDEAPCSTPADAAGERLLGAYGPGMTTLAGQLTEGAFSYLVPVEHTKRARSLLGTEAFLAVEQSVVIDEDPQRARATAREFLAVYLTTSYNLAKFRRLGYRDHDFRDGGSDQLVDDLVAWGSVEQVRTRIEQHAAAGADHVAVQLLGKATIRETLEQLRIVGELLGHDG